MSSRKEKEAAFAPENLRLRAAARTTAATSAATTATSPAATTTTATAAATKTTARAEGGQRRTARFLRGPVPLAWLFAASRAGGRALAVGLGIWWLVGVRRQDTVKINLSRFGDWGLSRSAASRGLALLETAGLVSVERSPGRAAFVTVHRDAGNASTSSSR